jgi:hypothetical protein
MWFSAQRALCDCDGGGYDDSRFALVQGFDRAEAVS